MPAHLCVTCGTQFPPADTPPARCPTCEDPRQYVNPLGQSWTTMEALARTHRNAFAEHEPGLLGIGTVPAFAIGQRALLVSTPSGNLLWDCISFLDAATRRIVAALGGIAAIAISHPHYYAAMVEWSRAFGDAPILLHEADRAHVMRPDPAIRFWAGETVAPLPGLTLLRLGGHFAGGTVLHWASGAGGAGALLSGDIVQVGPDRQVSFMRSYPNLIPLDAATVRGIAAKLEPWPFEPIYGAWWERVIPRGGKQALAHSVRRYLAALDGPPEPG
ncbi:MAG: MBL fold metallo-hydrolase [Rhodospirillales bacterium]|nr:MBL fold metallo-hydrolase [Rhodospirillales bacterium]